MHCGEARSPFTLGRYWILDQANRGARFGVVSDRSSVSLKVALSIGSGVQSPTAVTMISPGVPAHSTG